MSGGEDGFEVRQASDRVERRPVTFVVVASLLVATGAIAAVHLVLASKTTPSVIGAAREASRRPEPVGTLESSLVMNTARGLELRRAQRRELEAWRFVDRDAGIAQIPIEKAIDVLLEDPLPATRPIDPDGARELGAAAPSEEIAP